MRPLIVFWFAPVFAIFTLSPAAAQQNQDKKAREAFESACDSFDRGWIDTAAVMFRDFLRDYPKSSHAAEANYRLAATHLLLGQTEEAARIHEVLIREYFDSPWTQLVMQVHFDEKELAKIADEKRVHGLEGSEADLLAATKMYAYCMKRTAAKSAKAVARGEKDDSGEFQQKVLYKQGECQIRIRQAAQGSIAFEHVKEINAENGWGTLAALRLGNAHAFQERMDELIDLGGVEGEESRLYLELIAEHGTSLDKNVRCKSLYYQVLCESALGHEEKCVQLCQQIVKQYPNSTWCVDAAFWLADRHFRKKELELAKAAYLDLASNYPKSPHGEEARRWAGWIDRMDEAWEDVSKAVSGLLGRIEHFDGEFGLRVQVRGPDVKQSLDARVAYQDNSHYLLKAAMGDSAFLLANNRQGCWYWTKGRDQYTHVPAGILLPSPVVQATKSPTGGTQFGIGFADEAKAASKPQLRVDPAVIAEVAEALKHEVHLGIQKRHGPNGPERIFSIEQPDWLRRRLSSLVIRMNDKGELLGIQAKYPDKKEGSWTWDISEVVLGGKLPHGTFDIQVPADARVRQAEEMSWWLLWTDVVQFIEQISLPRTAVKK
jgi:outer membrane protein assembly factor BamD (BamD/ComL family)